MPSLQGYSVRTHPLPGGREVDILCDLEGPDGLWVPGQQIGTLTGYGRRAAGHVSTSDMAQQLDPAFVRRVPDPQKIYTRTRIKSTALFAVDGLVQKLCHTTRPEYVQFCRDLLGHVLPRYEEYAAGNAEVIMFWYEAMDHFAVTGKGPSEAGFEAAIKARDARSPADARPILVIGVVACEKVVCHDPASETMRLVAAPAGPGMPPVVLPVARLWEAHGLAAIYADQHQGDLAVAPHLALLRIDGSITLPDGTRITASAPGAGRKPGPSAEDVREALRVLLREELPGLVEPIVGRAVQARDDRGQLADLVRAMTDAVGRLAELAVANKDQARLMREAIDLVTPSHQMFCTAEDYIEMDGVEEALKRAPRLREPSLGLDHCPDHGKAALWMKRLCREENKKVAANAVAILMAEKEGTEPPPLYIPRYRMKRLERDNVKKLMYNPACWARLKQTFLPADTTTLLFPTLRAEEA